MRTLAEVAQRLLAIVPAATTELAQHWALQSWLRLCDRYNWSWKIGRTSIIIPASYQLGTVTCVSGADILLGAGGATFTVAMVGRQVRIGYWIATITNVDLGANTVTVDAPFPNVDGSYNYVIFQAYITPPDDFLSWVSCFDTVNNGTLSCHGTVDEIDSIDPQRGTISDRPTALVAFDYLPEQLSLFIQPYDTAGNISDPALLPRLTGAYTGSEGRIFTFNITGSGMAGDPGTAMLWRANDSPAQTIAIGLASIPLLEGLSATFPPSVSFQAGVIYAGAVLPVQNPSLPRFEIWPHCYTAKVLTAHYNRRTDATVQRMNEPLPRTIRGDVLLEMSLAEAAGWAGPSADKLNPYAQIARAERHKQEANQLIEELIRIDDEVFARSTMRELQGYKDSTSIVDQYFLYSGINQDSD